MRLKCSATEKSYGECGLFLGIHCQGQGEKNEGKIVKTETCKTRLSVQRNVRESRHSIVTKTPTPKHRYEERGLHRVRFAAEEEERRLYTVNKPRIGIKTDGRCSCIERGSLRASHVERRKFVQNVSVTQDGGCWRESCEFGRVFTSRARVLYLLWILHVLVSGRVSLMDPCRNPNREHVPRPPEQPPLLNGETPSYKESQTPKPWKEREYEGDPE